MSENKSDVNQHTQLIHLLTSEEVAGTTESAKERTSKSLNWRLIALFIHFHNFYSEILIVYLSFHLYTEYFLGNNGQNAKKKSRSSSAELSINQLLTEQSAQFAIIVNTIEKGNEQTHKLLRELFEEVKQQSKMNLQINDKTINAIATNSKETGQLITETLRKEKQTLSNNERHKNQTKKEKLNIETL